ncbi:MAG TPA: DUF3575 domain-containing protein [Fibrobacteria bacterium]|nr:DUF3575 domain-containing protein [Fibrobacteria bacterium]
MLPRFRLSAALLLAVGLHLALPAPASSQDTASDKDASDYRQSLFIQPLAFLSGVNLGYEGLVSGPHGILVEGVYEAWGASAGSGVGSLGYRYHFGEGLEGPFLGVFAKAGYLKGEMEAEDDNEKKRTFKFNTDLYVFGLNYGHRWLFDSGLNLVLRGGYGFPITDFQWTPGDPNPDFVKNLVEWGVGVDLEFSVGYSF